METLDAAWYAVRRTAALAVGCYAPLLDLEEAYGRGPVEMATKHMLTVDDAAQFASLAPEPVAWEACKLRDLGFLHEYICDALRFGEATTAFGLAYWIGLHCMRLTPDQIERMPWYGKLKHAEDAA